MTGISTSLVERWNEVILIYPHDLNLNVVNVVNYKLQGKEALEVEKSHFKRLLE